MSEAKKKPTPFIARHADACEVLAQQVEPRFATLMRHGTMSVELYEPQKIDPQSPHDQDELYVVIKGQGRFVCAGREAHFVAGDVLFAPARSEHRFVDFSDDFSAWVVFYGAKGGERDDG